jgi:hypothetical protein
MQITRHTSDKGEPDLLYVMRVVRVEAVCQSYQEWFPGPGREKKQEQDWLIWIVFADISIHSQDRLSFLKLSLQIRVVHFDGQRAIHVWL